MVSEGDVVRPYNVPAYTYDVIETDVSRDVEIYDFHMVIRAPSGDTLLQWEGEPSTYAVMSENLLNVIN